MLGHVVDVNHRGGDVGVAHVCLDVRERELLYGQGAEGVAQVVEDDAVVRPSVVALFAEGTQPARLSAT